MFDLLSPWWYMNYSWRSFLLSTRQTLMLLEYSAEKSYNILLCFMNAHRKVRLNCFESAS